MRCRLKAGFGCPPRDLDLESLPPAEAGRLRKLVERARLGGGATRALSGARDLVGYEIAIENDDRRTVAELVRHDQRNCRIRTCDFRVFGSVLCRAELSLALQARVGADTSLRQNPCTERASPITR